MAYIYFGPEGKTMQINTGGVFQSELLASKTPLTSEIAVDKSRAKRQEVDEDQDSFEKGSSVSDGLISSYKELLKIVGGEKKLKMELGDSAQSLSLINSLSGKELSEKELIQAKKELAFLKQAYLENLGAEKKLKPQDPMSPFFNFTESSVKNSLSNIRDVSRQIGWERVLEGFRDISSIPAEYKNYFMLTDVSPSSMIDVLNVHKDLRTPDSARVLSGNSASPLVSGEIWKRKMALLDDVITNPKKDGKPVEIDVEYYELSSDEMIAKLGQAADRGAKVRVVIDPGTLSSVEKDTFDASSIAVKSSSVEKLLRDREDKDIGVVLFPVKERLGARAEIMHRKLFRVGETVIFGGMNANQSSNENVDFAFEVQGSGARRVGEMFREDAQGSKGRSLSDIYGDQTDLLKNKEKTFVMGKWGLESLLSAKFGENAGINARDSHEEKLHKLINAAEKAKFNPGSIAEFTDFNKDRNVDGKDLLHYLIGGSKTSAVLTDKGRELLLSVMEDTNKQITSSANTRHFDDITPPEGKVSGKGKAGDVMSLGSTPEERQAMLLETINSAQKYIKVSSFVMNKDIANLLAEKKKAMEAQGKPFEVEVLMDPGLYGYGGTPNEEGFKALEDAGIKVKWNLLERTGDHDRKNHSKTIVTDDLIFTGSTNFSSKGLRDNWEANTIVRFDEKNHESAEARQKIISDFDRNFSRNAIEFDSKKSAQSSMNGYSGIDAEKVFDDNRNKSIRWFCRLIENYETQTARMNKTEVLRTGKSLDFEGMSDAELGRLRDTMSSWKDLKEASFD